MRGTYSAVFGLALQPFKWISHKAKLKSGLPIRGGLARLVAFGWMCKAYTVKDWIAFVETYGLPLRLGRYGPGATADDVETLFRAVANISTDAAAVLPESMKIDFEQITNGQGNDIFESLARWTDEQTSKAVLGQTMTSDNGSSQAQAEVHNEVRHDVAASDAKSVSGTLNRDLIKPFVDLNHGVQDKYPTITILIEEAEDTDKIIQNVDRMAQRGVRFKQSEVRARLGFSEPDADDEVIGVLTPPTKTNKTSTALNRPNDPSAITDSLEDHLNADWEDVMSEILGPVIELLETATNYDDATALVAEAFPKMNNPSLIDALVKSAVKARAEGDRPPSHVDVNG